MSGYVLYIYIYILVLLFFIFVLLFLRLWGDHGQRELEHAKVCLINASATGVETLKCLILPGNYIRSLF